LQEDLATTKKRPCLSIDQDYQSFLSSSRILTQKKRLRQWQIDFRKRKETQSHDVHNAVWILKKASQQSNMHMLVTCVMLERVGLKRFKKTHNVVAMCPYVIG